ncbi:MAG TPA: N-acetyltransferase [Candidatus Wirthbacteria bacterium]|nr:N-acetyltransferase [Candidatus Wirthbacteria bacterium]
MIKPYKIDYDQKIIQHVDSILGLEFASPVSPQIDPDLFAIEDYYQKTGGNFWIALDKDQVIGTIALINIGQNRGLLKRMYVQKEYRGKGVAQELLQTLLEFAQKNSFGVI